MKSEEWKSYRTRFLVNAKQLNSTLSFVDHLGRQHRGRKGDYLVESSEGVISIAPRHIFEDIYVPMPQAQASENTETQGDGIPFRTVVSTTTTREPEIDLQKLAALAVQDIEMKGIVVRKPSAGRQLANPTQVAGPAQAARVQRKLPQPYRDRRSPGSRMSLM